MTRIYIINCVFSAEAMIDRVNNPVVKNPSTAIILSLINSCKLGISAKSMPIGIAANALKAPSGHSENPGIFPDIKTEKILSTVIVQ